MAMIKRILVANRGEIASRIARTCRRLGVEVVAVHSDADRLRWHVGSADFAVRLGPASAPESYLSIDRVLEAARLAKADAIHPGYGFLSENAAFARACQEAGIKFIGPRPEHIIKLGSKSSARQIATRLGVPILPGYDGDGQDDELLVEAAARLGYPVLIKASAGGGGRGMRVVRTPESLPDSLRLARREALAGFGDDRLILERYIERARHVEVQIVGDGRGNCLHLGDRECSVQRGYQKVIEEAPAPAVPDDTRAAIRRHAIALARSVEYESLGTAEFILDSETGEAYFLEMNTRIQVEHPVSEMVTGLDLVELQLRVADAGSLPFTQEQVRLTGAAIETRILAERPDKGFAPQTGVITRYEEPVGPGLRIDGGVGEGTEVTAFYDSLLSKLIAWGETREAAIDRVLTGVVGYRIDGIGTNLGLLEQILRHGRFRSSTATTRWLDEELQTLIPGADSDRQARLAVLCACALQFHEESCPKPGRSVWQRLASWRITAAAGFPAVSTWRLVDEEAQEHCVRVAGNDGSYTAIDGGSRRVIAMTRLSVDRLLISDGPVSETIRFVREGDRIRIADRSGFVAFALARPIEAGGHHVGTDENAATVRAPLPGLLVEVRVAVGDQVSGGATVAAIESMKMVHLLVAAADGVVSEVLRSPGDLVSQNEPLIVIEQHREPDGSPGALGRSVGASKELRETP